MQSSECLLIQSIVHLFMYSVKQSADRYFNHPNSHPIIRSVKSSYDRTSHACFDPLSLVALKWREEALSPKNRIAESVGIFVAVTIPTWNGCRLARLYGGRFNVPTADGRNVFAKGK